MRGIIHRSAAVLSLIALLFAGTTPAVALPSGQSKAMRVESARQVHAAGSFTALVDFSTLAASDVARSKCAFQVEGTLAFTGTLDGVARGRTTALIDAPCSEALSNAPGTFRDLFRFDGDFAGTVDGAPTTGPLSYAGVTRPGGSIDAGIVLRGDSATAALRAIDARLAVGGRYRGIAVNQG
jgi:hypothetical protein